jgi:flagellar motor switch protein FliM
MSENEVLSKEEIEALVSGVDSGAVHTNEGYRLHDGVPRPVDLAANDLMLPGRMPALEMIGSKFKRNLRVSLFNFLRRAVDVTYIGLQTVKYAEYIQSLPVPTSLNLMKMSPLRGLALLVLESRLVFAMVNGYFGGDPRISSHIGEREFTAMENRIIEMTLEIACRDMQEAWASVLPIELEQTGAEINPQFANIANPGDVVLIAKFNVDIEGASGELHLAMPYAMLEPVRDHLDAGVAGDRTAVDDRWAVSMRQRIQMADVDVSVTLADTPISLGQLARLEAGQVVPVDLPQTVLLCAEGVPLFRCTIGVSNGFNAVQVLHAVNGDPTR